MRSLEGLTSVSWLDHWSFEYKWTESILCIMHGKLLALCIFACRNIYITSCISWTMVLDTFLWAPMTYSPFFLIMTVSRVYYTQAVWRSKPILGAGLRVHSHLFGGLLFKNHKFSSRLSDLFAYFCGDHSNREPSNLYFYPSFVASLCLWTASQY